MSFKYLIEKSRPFFAASHLLNKTFYSTSCWSCKREFKNDESKQIICPCSKSLIQPVNKTVNYFELFKLPIKFEINQSELTRSFRTLMKVLHPDRYTNKSETEKQYSTDQSSYVNNAYKVLTDDLERAFYILKLKNFDKDPENSTMDQEFLVEILEMNEELERLKEEKEIKKFDEKLLKEIELKTNELKNAFHSDNLNQVHSVANKLKYYKNLHETLKDVKLKEILKK